jgi:squalene-associated FAD-dependent desaturase
MTFTRVAIIGGGWAGLAAAVAGAQAGLSITLFEAARAFGGRARSLVVTGPQGNKLVLDNGQHILIGAYTETLRLMDLVGAHPERMLLRLPLTLQYPDGSGLVLPDARSPFDALAGILRTKGWSWGDRLSLLRAAIGWQLRGFRCAPGTSVRDLARGVTARVHDELLEPLCVSALNTPTDRSSGEVFLRVLRDSLFGQGHGSWNGSNLLLPRAPLGRLFPEAACVWLARHGVGMRSGERVREIVRDGARWLVDGAGYDQVILACPPWEAARLVAQGALGGTQDWQALVDGLGYEAITTVYATGGPRLAQPMLALRSGPGAPAQFVFDRSQLDGPPGLLAFVASASEGDRDAIEGQVLRQAAGLGWHVQALQTVVEKRATFACTPGLRRPGQAVAPGLWACGDYVEGPYPATIEGAVRSALAAVAAVSASARPAPSGS